MTSVIDFETQKKYARIAGLLYLIIFITAGFAEGYVRSGLIVAGDAATTAQNILNAQGLFRLALAGDLITFISDAIVAVLLYLLLKEVNKPLAIIVMVLRVLAHPAIGSINLVNHLSALNILIDPVLAVSLGIDQVQQLAMQALIAHKTGYLIAGAFFGVQCALLGYLIYKSDLIPKVIGLLLMVAAVGYLIESFGGFLLPQYSELYSMIVAIPAIIAEGALCLWLLIKGIKTQS